MLISQSSSLCGTSFQEISAYSIMHGKLYVSDPKLWEQTFKDMVSGKLNPYQYARSPQTVIYHSIVANIYLLAQLTCRHVTKSNTTGATSGAGTAYLSGFT